MNCLVRKKFRQRAERRSDHAVDAWEVRCYLWGRWCILPNNHETLSRPVRVSGKPLVPPPIGSHENRRGSFGNSDLLWRVSRALPTTLQSSGRYQRLGPTDRCVLWTWRSSFIFKPGRRVVSVLGWPSWLSPVPHKKRQSWRWHTKKATTLTLLELTTPGSLTGLSLRHEETESQK